MTQPTPEAPIARVAAPHDTPDERHAAATEKLAAAAPASVRRFVWALFAAAVLLIAAVACGNAIVDPYGTTGSGLYPTVTTSDRTVKLDLIDRLPQPPQAIILGSSRATRFEPSYFQSRTGLRTFNASVNGVGGLLDAFAMTSYLSDRFPDTTLHYFWVLDVESFVPVDLASRITGEPRLAKYVNDSQNGTDALQRLKTWLHDAGTLLSWTTARASVHVATDTGAAFRASQTLRARYKADGFLKSSPKTAVPWQVKYARERYPLLYRTSYKSLDSQAVTLLERTLALMNRRGSHPLIVLSPMQPWMLDLLRPLGWEQRHRQVLALLGSLHAKYAFTLLDMTSVANFKGDPTQFYDGVHMTPLNSRLLAAAALARAGGSF